MSEPLVDVPEPEDRREREAVIYKAAELLESFEGDPQKLATIAAQFWLAARGRVAASGDSLSVMPGVSAMTGEGFIEVSWAEQRRQMRPQDARDLAATLVEAAELALADAALFAFCAEGADYPSGKGSDDGRSHSHVPGRPVGRRGWRGGDMSAIFNRLRRAAWERPLTQARGASEEHFARLDAHQSIGLTVNK